MKCHLMMMRLWRWLWAEVMSDVDKDEVLFSFIDYPNNNLLESLYDDDDKVRTMTTTQNSLHMIQLSAIPIACLGGNGVGTCSYMNIF